MARIWLETGLKRVLTVNGSGTAIGLCPVGGSDLPQESNCKWIELHRASNDRVGFELEVDSGPLCNRAAGLQWIQSDEDDEVGVDMGC